MPNHAADEQPAEQSEELPLDQEVVAAALVRLFMEEYGPRIDERLNAPVGRLLKAYEETSQPAIVARVGGLIAGKYTVNLARGKFVVADGKALDAYAEDNGGMEVIIRRNPTWEKALLNNAVRTDSGEIIDKRTGQVVPGLAYVPGGQPTGKVTFTWADGGEGRKNLIAAWQRGDLDHLLKKLPMLTSAPPAGDESA